jgi:phasin family protein
MAKSDTTMFGMDFTKYMPDFGSNFALPGINAEAIMDVQKKNLEAFGKASKLAADGIEELFKRQGEMFKASVEEFDTAVKTTTEKGLPDFNPEKQAEVAKAGFENAVANSRELVDMATTSGKKVYDVISKRAAESVADIKTVAPTAKA